MLNDASEHPKGEHIEKEVLPTAVEEHVGEELEDIKIVRQRKVQS
jgi:hypothetical protein